MKLFHGLTSKVSTHKGQSTIEYAAALVVAAVLIAGVLPLSSQALTGCYQAVFSTIEHQLGQ